MPTDVSTIAPAGASGALLTGHWRVLHLVSPRSQSYTRVSGLRIQRQGGGRLHWSPRKSPRDIFSTFLFLGAAQFVSHGSSNLTPCRAGQKSRRSLHGRSVGGGGRPTHDCGLVSTRSEFPRAVRVYMRAGSALKRSLCGWWCRWGSRLVCGPREICKCKCDSAILGWVCARLTSPSTRAERLNIISHRCRTSGGARAMKQPYDPGQVTHPLDVVKQAAGIGGLTAVP